MNISLYNDVASTITAMDELGMDKKQMKQWLLNKVNAEEINNTFWSRIEAGEFTMHQYMVAIRKALKALKSTFYQPTNFTEWNEDIYNH